MYPLDQLPLLGVRDVDRTEKDRFPLNRYLSFLRSSESINRVKKIDLLRSIRIDPFVTLSYCGKLLLLIMAQPS